MNFLSLSPFIFLQESCKIWDIDREEERTRTDNYVEQIGGTNKQKIQIFFFYF
jgi:hypothetical protein